MPPFQLPAPLIHLVGICRPRLLRPDLRVKTIANVDFRALRRDGFNAVVIDKDNCLTLPEKDELFPPLKDAWTRLLAAFPPGRVLVVSNSAGTKKDPGGIAAEHVALKLRCPVLLHSKPKPACSEQILKYFRGELGAPRTLQSNIRSSAERVIKEENEDEQILVKKWLKEVDGPICGPPTTPAKPTANLFTNEMDEDRRKALEDAWNAPTRVAPPPLDPPSPSIDPPLPDDATTRILVIGDRLFTDTLLAHRLRLHMGVNDPLKSERVISIHTTQLPKPGDVRLLRWIENRLSGGSTRLRETSTDWGRFVIADNEGELAVGDRSSLPVEKVGLLQRLREIPPLTLSPSSWRPLPLLFGLGRGIRFILLLSVNSLVRVIQWSWARIRSRTSATKEVIVEEIKQEQKLDAAPK